MIVFCVRDDKLACRPGDIVQRRAGGNGGGILLSRTEKMICIIKRIVSNNFNLTEHHDYSRNF
jgi:hypothetical protein